MTRIAQRPKTTARISVQIEKTQISYIMKARKKKTATETIQLLIDEETERLKSWKLHQEIEGQAPREQFDDHLL